MSSHLVGLLLEFGANPNVGIERETPLHIAVRVASIKLVSEKEIGNDNRENDKKTPFFELAR